MSDCCAPKNGQAPDPHSDRCPRCGAKGPRVDAITLKALLSGEGLRRGVPAAPRFCGTLGCPVVYFDNAVPVVFEEALVTVTVHAKHPEDGSLPVCYCFGHTPETIRRELASTGRSSASKTIAAEVKAGHCACEVKNPKGTCCLGDVSKVERSALLPAAAGVASFPTAGSLQRPGNPFRGGSPLPDLRSAPLADGGERGDEPLLGLGDRQLAPAAEGLSPGAAGTDPIDEGLPWREALIDPGLSRK